MEQIQSGTDHVQPSGPRVRLLDTVLMNKKPPGEDLSRGLTAGFVLGGRCVHDFPVPSLAGRNDS